MLEEIKNRCERTVKRSNDERKSIVEKSDVVHGEVRVTQAKDTLEELPRSCLSQQLPRRVPHVHVLR